MEKNDTLDPTIQVVEAGAAITLSPEILAHGIAIDHPDLPLFKLYFHVQDGRYKYHFEPCTPNDPRVEQFAVKIVEPKPVSTLILPGQHVNGRKPG